MAVLPPRSSGEPSSSSPMQTFNVTDSEDPDSSTGLGDPSRRRSSSASFVSAVRERSGLLVETLDGSTAEDAREVGRQDIVIDTEGEHMALPKTRGVRKYYLDWLRVSSIYVVVVFHCGKALVETKTLDGNSQFTKNFLATAMQFGMPVFFHISGRAQALTKTANVSIMILQRSFKLLLPMVVCWCLFVPISDWFKQEYVDPIWVDIGFWPRWFWFLALLATFGINSAPIFKFSESSGCALAASGAIHVAVSLGWVSLMLFADVEAACTGIWFMGQLVVMGLVLIVPLPPKNGIQATTLGHQTVKTWAGLRLFLVLQIFVSAGMAGTWEYKESNAFLIFTLEMLTFYQAGYFMERWGGHLQNSTEADEGGTPPHVAVLTGLIQVLTPSLMVLAVAFSSPVGSTQGWFYPVYSKSFNPDGKGPDCSYAISYVIGTWGYIGLIFLSAQRVGNSIIHRELHKHATQSTIVVYLTHEVFIGLFAFRVFDKQHLDLSPPVSWIASFVFTVSSSLGAYFLLIRYVPSLGFLFGV